MLETIRRQNGFNSLPNDKLRIVKIKTFADDEFNVVKMTISACDRVDTIVGKGVNSGHGFFNVNVSPAKLWDFRHTRRQTEYELKLKWQHLSLIRRGVL